MTLSATDLGASELLQRLRHRLVETENQLRGLRNLGWRPDQLRAMNEEIGRLHSAAERVQPAAAHAIQPLLHALRDAGINLIQTKVGDRYVLEAMREGGYVIGGEQSGHTIFLEHNSTGDGLVTALQFLAACKRAGKSAGEAAKAMTRFPQTLINVRVKDKHAADGNQAIADAVAAAEAALGEDGRVLLRPSGTEPVVRVMVEAMDEQAAERHAKAIAEVVECEI